MYQFKHQEKLLAIIVFSGSDNITHAIHVDKSPFCVCFALCVRRSTVTRNSLIHALVFNR